MNDNALTILASGDLVLDVENAEICFDYVRNALKTADLSIGQIEVVFTLHKFVDCEDIPAPPCDPKNLPAVKSAGFDMITLAGNHVYDSGSQGIKETINGLNKHGIVTAGAGCNIDAARKPALIKRQGIRFGILSYNCVGPKRSWASSDKSGCAYVKIITHYELENANPGGPPNVYSFPEIRSLEAMKEDIKKLRSQCDIVIVALHKGLVHTPIKLAMYEQPLCYAALDAGADAVIGHHAHILKGIEFYHGKPIFHGLGNLVTLTKALTEAGAGNAVRKEWARKRKEIFGFEPNPDYPLYPFHPEAVNAMIAYLEVVDGKIIKVGYLPCLINKQGIPELLKNDSTGQKVFDYIKNITEAADLNARFEWDGDKVIAREKR